MKQFVILLFLAICCLNCKAQTVLPTTYTADKHGVIMDTSTYRKLWNKNYECDTSLAEKNQLLQDKDSLNSLLKIKIDYQKQLISEKDTTIINLKKNNDQTIKYLQAAQKKDTNIFKNAPAWIGVTVGLFVGFLIAK